MDNLYRLLEKKLVGIMRTPHTDRVPHVTRAMAEGGIEFVEISFNVPGTLGLLESLTAELGSRVVMGAGTVLDAETARAVILAGGEFMVSPTADPEMIKMCKRYAKVSVPGAFTATEVQAAWENGGDLIKIFPF